jgi:hypothetical protein
MKTSMVFAGLAAVIAAALPSEMSAVYEKRDVEFGTCVSVQLPNNDTPWACRVTLPGGATDTVDVGSINHLRQTRDIG